VRFFLKLNNQDPKIAGMENKVMPTNLEIATLRKLEAKKEAQFLQTVMLLCVISCLLNLMLVFESPAYAAAVSLSGRY